MSVICYKGHNGVLFEWGEIKFTLPLDSCEMLTNMILEQQAGFSSDDDLTKPIWLGDKVLRCGIYRVPIKSPDSLYEMIMNILEPKNDRYYWNARTAPMDRAKEARDIFEANKAMKEIHDNLGLND